MKFNKNLRDKVHGMEEETKNKIKDYWKSRVYDHANKTAMEVKDYE